MTSLYRALKPLARFICIIYLKLRIQKPFQDFPEGPIVICCNHCHALDPVAIALASKRQVFFMAKKELFEKPRIRRLLMGLGSFPVDRDGNDIKSIRHSITLLKEGKVLGIFPEGTRSIDGNIHSFHGGAAMLALRTGATLIPAGIVGKWKFRARISLVLGEAMDLSEYLDKRVTQEDVAQVTSLLEKRVIELHACAKRLQ